MRKGYWIKLLSLLLCIGMLVPVVALLPLHTFAAADGDSDFSSSTSKETVYIDGVYYHIERTVSYTGNSTFSLNLRLHTSLSETEKPLRRTAAQNGYFTVDTAGYYLLELWGGAGADGGDILHATHKADGGNGGAAGYVYAKVWLDAGQTLAYSIGTNGAQAKKDGDGGGMNGTGGEHGEEGNIAVGGGGGYSALYFFDEGEFDPAWLNAQNNWSMPESARVSHYVMIAAGGGGGGGANGALYAYATDGNGNVKTADGGAGGSITNGISLALNGSAYPVEGYIFSGRNGKSSGTSTAYVGKGGTNVPGSDPASLLGIVSPTSSANDWTGSYNLETAPGAGGTGNLRGGGGGAGYCGGSGGVMEGRILTGNVGGGGGGSSFLAKKFGEKEAVFGNALDAEVSAQLKGSAGVSEISGVGGAFSYTYLGDGTGGNLADTSYLTSVKFEGKFSQYFDAISYYSSDGTTGDMGTPNANGVMTYDSETGAFSVTGANINSATLTEDGVLLSLHFTLRPKQGFMGGNDVPLLESGTLKATVQRSSEKEYVIEASADPKTERVNVPLQFRIVTNSTMLSLKGEETSVSFPLTDVYEAEYTDAIAAFAKTNDSNYPDWGYDFISKLSDYRVYAGKYEGTGSPSGTTLSGTQTISQTTHYTVAITVTPKIGTYAEVGPATKDSTKVIWSTATVTVVSSDIFSEGWEYLLTANKTLSYKDGDFHFAQQMTQSLERSYQESIYRHYTGSNTVSTETISITVTGYYLIQAWGAKGGNGGGAKATAKYEDDKTSQVATANGGSGANGASIYGFVYLHAGDTLTLTLGKAGSNYGVKHVGVDNGGSTGTTYVANGTGGGGGSYTAVTLTRDGNQEYLMIAGGGGGGAGGGAGIGCFTIGSWNPSKTTYSGSSAEPNTDVSNEFSGNIGDYKGSGGNSGNVTVANNTSSPTGSYASSGDSRPSYVNDTYLNKGLTDSETVYIGRLADMLVSENGVNRKDTNNSASQVTYICSSDTTELLDAFPGVEASGTFSKYFDIDTDENGYCIDMAIEGETPDEKVVVSENGVTTVTYYKNGLLIASFGYTLTENEDGTKTYDILSTVYHPTFELIDASTQRYRANCGFSIDFRLKPVDGFLGGNDVPVLAETGTDRSTVSVKKGDSVGFLSVNNIADYANVEVNYDLAADFSVQDGYVVLGDTDQSNDSISTEDLFELTTDLTPPTPEDAWKYERVQLVYPATEILTPTANTTVTLTAKIVPVAAPQKAVVSSNIDGIAVSETVNVFVKYPVIFDFAHLQGNGEALAIQKNEYTVALVPEEGYLLPSQSSDYISVTVGNGSVPYDYDTSTGVIKISSYYVSGAIVIKAKAKTQEYSIKYTYMLDGDTEATAHTRTEWYEAGSAIDYTWLSEIPAKEGHVFHWEWDTNDGQQPTEMPGYNVTATGKYEKIRYQLTVNYVDSAGNPVHAPYVAMVEYQAEYRVVSPGVENYMASSAVCGDAVLADPFVVTGRMEYAGPVTVTVTYTFAQNRLVILYLNQNGEEIATRYDVTLSENAAYDVLSPAVDGYTVKNGFEAVSGTMIGTESKTVTVYYDPNRYTVNFEYRYEGNSYPGPRPDGVMLDFDFSSATLEGDGYTVVEFGNLYTFNVQLGEYGLPTPLALGYVFEGWYADTDYTVRIDDESIVTLPAATTLYAKWAPMKYTVTLKYDFVFDAGDFLPNYAQLPEGTQFYDDGNGGYYYQRIEFYVGQNYTILLGAVTGYTSYTEYGTVAQAPVGESIAGTMPAMPVMYPVTYEINVYTIRFLDLGGVDCPEALRAELPLFEAEWQTMQLKHGVIPVYSGIEPMYRWSTENPLPLFEQYTFRHSYWESSVTGAKHGASETLPAATCDVDYFAWYAAKENIAILESYQGTVLGYYDSVQHAADAGIALAQTSSSYTPVVRLCRVNNPDTSIPIDLCVTEKVPTIRIYAPSSYYLKIDLNGYTLLSDATVIENFINLTLVDSVGTGEIAVSAPGDVTAIVTQTRSLYIGSGSVDAPCGVKLTVRSQNGTAIGVATPSGKSISGFVVYAGSTIDVAGETAYGIRCDYSSMGSPLITVRGALSVQSNAGVAYGVWAQCETALGVGGTVTVTSLAGDAYGWYAKGSPLKLAEAGVSVSANAYRNAYGIYLDKLDCADVGEINISATSQTGDATAVYCYGNFRGNSAYTLNAVANAPAGAAIAIYSKVSGDYALGSANRTYVFEAIGQRATTVSSLASAVTVWGTLRATGTNTATALYTAGPRATLQTGAVITAVTESGRAYALYGTELSFAAADTVATVTASAKTGMAVLAYDTSITGASDAAVLTATTQDGEAYGLYSTTYVIEYTYTNAAISVIATGEGTAYGAYFGTTVDVGAVLTVSGKNAYGIWLATHSNATLTNAVLQVSNSAADGVVYGIYVADGGNLVAATATVTATSEAGDAYGVSNSGTITSIAANVTVNAKLGAYGLVAAGSSDIATADGFVLTVTSQSANSYGLYADGADMGDASLDGSIRYGVITALAENGNGYAVYGNNGTAYIRGVGLYYKGNTDANARGGNVVIYAGYYEQQCAADDVNYPGYFYLTAKVYTITFVERDLDNRVGTVYGPFEYTPETTPESMTFQVPTHSASPDFGYSVKWEEFDFSVPTAENQDPNDPTNKFVYSVYTKKTFTVTVYYNDDANFSETFSYLYLDPVAIPDMVGRTKYGHSFSGVYYLDSTLQNAYDFSTPMGSADLVLYAGWVKGTFTITFHTSGGSALAPVTGLYGDSVSVSTPARPGYSFDGWYYDEGLTRYYGYSVTTIPGENIALYASWAASISLVVLGDPQAYTVRLNLGIDTDGDGANDTMEYNLTGGMLDYEIVADLCMVSSLPKEMVAEALGMDAPVFVRGWKTAQGKFVNLADGIGKWGVTPVDGVIDLYLDFTMFDDAVDAVDVLFVPYISAGLDLNSGDSLSELGIDIFGSRYDFYYLAEVPAACNGADGGYVYMTYRALCDGTHKIALTCGSGSLDAKVSVLETDGDERDLYNGDVCTLGSVADESGLTTINATMQKGEILLVRYYIPEGGEDDAAIMLAQLPQDKNIFLIDTLVMMHNAMDFFFYTADMGKVALPTHPQNGYEGVSAWKYKENGVLSEQSLTHFTTDMFNVPDAWMAMPGADISLITLYPVLEDLPPEVAEWLASITEGRHFNPQILFDLAQTYETMIRANGAVSFAFVWSTLLTQMNPTLPEATLGTLHFASGLPAGTTLSLVDCYGEYPVFYYYIVTQSEDGLTELPLSRFVELGGTRTFDGISPAMMFNISYGATAHTLTQESVTMTLDVGESDVALGYTFKHTQVVSYGTLNNAVNTSFSGTIPIPNMTGRGYHDDDIVLLTLRVEDANGNPVMLPSNLGISGDGTIMNIGTVAGTPLGTVGQLNATRYYRGTLDLETLRYHLLTGTLYYEIVVVPFWMDLSGTSFLGVDTVTDTRYTVSLQLKEAPHVTFAQSKGTASAGDTLTLSTAVGELTDPVAIELFVYQRVGTQMQYTDACATLLRDHLVDENGRVTDPTVTEGASFTGGELTLTLNSADGGIAAGVYFLVATYGGNYAVYTLTVMP